MGISDEDFEIEKNLHGKLKSAYLLGYKTGILNQTLQNKKRMEVLIRISEERSGFDILEHLKIELDLLDTDIHTINETLGFNDD